MPGFHVENFGCRAARADGEAIAGSLHALSEHQPFTEDVVVVNTCSVTAEADRTARAFIRRAHRRNPAARIFVTGCYAQRAPDELAAMPGVAAIIGNSHKALAPEIIARLMSGHNLSDAENEQSLSGALASVQSSPPSLPSFISVNSLLTANARAAAPIWADDRFAHSFLEDPPLATGAQTRPNLKIQEGCSNRCTFCVIPLTRGPSRSLPNAVVLGQIAAFVASGGNELVLSGINLGRWGCDFSGADRWSLARLVRAIFRQTSLPRLRLSSIEPMDWDDEPIALVREFAGCRLARHVHLPLQSGSDSVLRRMHRRYRPWHYAEKVAALFRAAGPDLTLGADVMVGFPGETDREFDETMAFLRALPFGYLHLFPFSPRPATLGWALHAASPVAPEIVTARMATLRALAAEKSRAHRNRFIGRQLPAITLHTPASAAAAGYTAALTDNFLPVLLIGRFPANQLLTAQVTGLTAGDELVASSSGDASDSSGCYTQGAFVGPQ